MGNLNDENETTEYLDVAYWEQIITTIMIGLVAVAGIIGNSMIIMAVAFSCKLQTSTNALVTSLGVTDLLTSVMLVFYLIGTLGKPEEGGWPYPKAYWVCQITAFVLYAAIGTSLYHMASIALNRFVLIVKPSLYPVLFARWKLGLFILVPWIVPSVGIMILVLSGIGEFGYDPADLACAAVDYPGNTLALSLLITLIGFPVPLVVISVSYVRIYVHVKKHFQKMKRQTEQTFASITGSKASTDSVLTMSSHAETDVNKSQRTVDRPEALEKIAALKKNQILQQQVKITKNLFMTFCAFLLCFLPYFILIFVPNSEHSLFYTKVLIYANCAINLKLY
ncbi:G-protein coupled receptor moody-like [Amphiura filiformis]|uniref:G-protein coupled receptor moody-like n=1 Tax=Amphiura filiformis TaxID=82378 RepID=UPI003B21A7A9